MSPKKPPILALLLLRALLRGEAREVIPGDLEEEYRCFILPRSGTRAARRWFWRQTFASLGARWAWGSRAPSMAGAAEKGDGIVITIMQDVHFALRLMWKKPGFTLAAVLTLALGIGANTAIFSVVEHLVLRALPYENDEGIVTVWENNRRDGLERDDVSPANFLDWRERNGVFERMATSNPWSMEYVGDGEPETLASALVSEGFFEILGARALLGRTLLRDDYRPGQGNVAVMSYGLWQRKFGGDPAVLGKNLRLNGENYQVVGILPRHFRLRLHMPERGDLLMPQPDTPNWPQQRRATYLNVLARLRPGVTLEQAQAEMERIAAQLAEEYPQTNTDIGARVVPLREHLVGEVRPGLLMLMGAVGFVLLIACANVANLMLARGSEREREIAIRSAVGAGTGRLFRQMLTESLVLAACGSIAGLFLAGWSLRYIVGSYPGNVPLMDQVQLNGTVVVFALGMGLLTAVVFGIVPALHVRRLDVQQILKEGTAGSGSGAASPRLRGLLVVAEVAMAVVLMAGAGLLLRSFVSLQSVDPGYSRTGVAALQAFVYSRYRGPDQYSAFARQVMDNMRGLPGIGSVGIVSSLPLFESAVDPSYPVTVEGRPAPPPGQETTAFATIATAEYFSAMGIPLLRGRFFNEFDTPDSSPVVVVNDAMARRFDLGDDPVGKRISVQYRQRTVSMEVIGMVGSLKHTGLDADYRPEFFRPFWQSPTGGMIFVISTPSDPLALMPALKDALWRVNKDQPIYNVATMEQLVATSLSGRLFNMLLLGAFASLALILAAVGIFGVISFSTAQRTREIGIRMSLGARPGDILRMVIRQGMKWALAGVVLGLVGALALTRLMESLLFGVTPADPLTYAAISAVLLAVAYSACYLPARRATRVDPLTALRYE